jgi:oligoendopeptidase F
VRTPEVEEVLALAHEATGGTSTVFKLFNDADLKFPNVRDDEGQGSRTHARALHQVFGVAEARRARRRFQNHARRVLEVAQHARRFAFWRGESQRLQRARAQIRIGAARALSPDEIPTEVYTNLIGAVRERLPVLHRYLRLRKKMLGLDDLQMWDLYVPMVKEVEREIPYEEAKRSVAQSLQPMGEQYLRVLDRAFNERWIDVLENEGKTSGAFSDGAYTTPPYILMNWQDNLNNAFTLTHELGHSLHSHFTRETQPYVYSHYTIFVAEVASTLNEALLTNYMQQQAKEQGDRALQLYLLNSYAERFRTTLYRQTMFAEFELMIHQTVERGEALTAESMSDSYLQLNKDFYGAEVNVDDCVSIEWSRIPHFYYDFYVYQYATGISAAAALSKQIVEEGQPAVERYLNFPARRRQRYSQSTCCAAPASTWRHHNRCIRRSMSSTASSARWKISPSKSGLVVTRFTCECVRGHLRILLHFCC